MKRSLIKIGLIILVIIIAMQKIVYADVVFVEDQIKLAIEEILKVIGYLTTGVLGVSVIALLALKVTDKNKENKKDKNTLQEVLYYSGLIISVLGIVHLLQNSKIINFAFICLAILFTFTIIVKFMTFLKSFSQTKNQLKTIASTLCFITAILTIFLYICFNKTQQFNNIFLHDVIDSKQWIDNVIKNNKGDKKITVKYKDKYYKTEEELKQLYYDIEATFFYAEELEYNFNGYIKVIEVKTKTDVNKKVNVKEMEEFNEKFKKYEGKDKSWRDAVKLINLVNESNKEQENYNEKHIVELIRIKSVDEIKKDKKYNITVSDKDEELIGGYLTQINGYVNTVVIYETEK